MFCIVIVTYNVLLLQLPYVTSLLALYIPYDFSFHAEMTSLESYGLRYFPPLIALITVPIAASVR